MKIRFLFLIIMVLFLNSSLYSNNLFKIGGTSEDYGRDIAVDLEGSSIVTGYFNNSVNFNPNGQAKNFASRGKTDIYLVKYNSDGQFVWGFSIGGLGDDETNRVFADFLGNYYIVGYFSNTVDFDPSTKTANKTSKGGKDVFLAKYNYDGDFQWVVTFGGPLDDEATDVFVDILANVYITGFFSGKIDMDSTDGEDSEDTFTSTNQNYDIFVASYNELGDYNLGFILGGTGIDKGTGIRATIAGDIIVSGNFENTVDFDVTDKSYNLSSAGSSDFFIASYDFLNELNFAFKFGGNGVDFLSYGGMELDGKDNIILAGSFTGTVNFNPNGQAQLTWKGMYDGFLAKYSPSGSFLWAFNIGSTGDDQVTRISVGSDNNIAISGFFSGKADFDPSQNGTYELTPKATGNSTDGFVAYYSSDGKFIWANGHGTSGTTTFLNNTTGVFISNNNDIQTTGRFYGAADFYTMNETQKLNSAGSSDIFLAKYSLSGNFKGSDPQPFIKVLSPNGGEVWKVGDKNKIEWASSNIEKIKIEYSTNGGTNWIVIKENVNASDANFDWTVPETPSKNCLVKISHQTYSAQFDQSDAPFEIYKPQPPKIILVQPNGGERWRVGDSHKIQWNATNADKVKIEYSTNSGVNWILIKENVNADDSGIDWTIPETPSTYCLVKVSHQTNPDIFDESDNLFEIYQSSTPQLTIIQPNGGETIKAGSSYQIRWSFSGDNQKIKIYFTSDNGENWTEISTELDATIQSYIWSVPDIKSDNCRIRIKDTQTNGEIINVQSQGNFKIDISISVFEFKDNDNIKAFYDNNLDALLIELNPADDYLRSLDLYDLNGDLMFNNSNLENQHQHIINLRSQSSGIYLLRLNFSNGIITKLILVIR
ncbi:MAG: T9SS type A sorting domain-containing protein [Candidatus Kapabacteria bacterium]|nr:T9SS type A sorting domain-containing protein [Candidatus Kapabacteria bacterium]